MRGSRTAVVAIAVCGVALAATGAGAAGSPTAPPPTYLADDYSGGHVFSILPSGTTGLVNAIDLAKFEKDGTRPANSQDQYLKYAGLLYGSAGLTPAQLPNFYKEESFGIRPQDIVRTEQPATSVPVAIYRDKFGVPHIYGATTNAMEYGAGYAGAEDRLFFMDVLRHYGEGTTSQFLGPSCADERMDHDQLLLTGYTAQARQAQVDSLPTQYGAQGARFKQGLDNYVAGVNAYIAAAQTDPSLLPADYGAALQPPQPWNDGDVIAIAGLVGGIFGKGGGNELANAGLLSYLNKQLSSPAAAQQVFTAFKDQNDPVAPTTITDRSFPYEIPGPIDPRKTVVPDDPSAPLTGGPTNTTPNCDLTKPNPTALGAVRDLLAFPKSMSNALLVDAKHSTTGHPVAVFGPQVGYFAPQILMEEDLHAPDFAAEGASFAGTNAIVELGRGQDYAWSATSAGTDNVDTVLEQVCDPKGGAPQPNGTAYLFQGRCTPMTTATFDDTSVPKPGGLGAPTTLSHTLYFTRHGVVQGWTNAGGKPVAVVTERSTYGHELDSGIGFLAWNTPSLTHDAASWMHGATEISYTFNWFYIDDRDIAYYVSGKDPVRPPDVNPNLPVTGTGSADWQGFLPDAAHPQETNPPQGFFTSWNNKPAPGFSASDALYAYGASYRSQSLDDAIRAELAGHGGRIDQANLVSAMESAATVDLSGTRVLPALLDFLGTRPQPAGVAAMVSQLRGWLASGAHRKKANPGDAQYADASAVAIMDELYPRLIAALLGPLLAGGGTMNDLYGVPYSYRVLPMEFANTPNSNGAKLGSAYDGGYEGYLQTLLRQLHGSAVGDAFPAALTDRSCGPGGAAKCPTAVDSALSDTYGALVSANGGSTDVASFTKNRETVGAAQTQPQLDAIHFQAVGIVGQPDPDWQNRPTFQQVVMFPAHRSRTASAGSPRASTPPSVGPGSTSGLAGPVTSATGNQAGGGALAATGGSPWPALAGLAVLAAAGGLARRRSRGHS